MARLINDSGVLGDSITVTAKTVNSVSFDKIIEAIGVIQDEMGITGTTAKEAASTISGSAKAMKSAWTNLLAGLAGGNANLDDLIGNFVDSVKTLGGNVMPVLERVLGGAVDLVNGLAPVIAGALPSLVSQVAPDLIKGGISILEALIRGISENVGMLADSAAEVIVSLVTGLIGLLPELLVAGQQILLALADALVEALPELIPAITETVTEIVRLLTEPDTLGLLLEASIAIIMALAEGLIKALPDLIKALPEIINNMVEFLVSQAPQIVLAGVELLMALVNGIVSALPALTDAAINLVTQVYNTLSSSVGKLVDIGSQIVQSIKNGISSAWSGLVSWFEGLWDSLFGNRNVDVNVNASSSGTAQGSHAGGLTYVPYDNFMANLHKGERVLTNEEAREYNAGRTGGGITIVQNISATPTTPIELAAATQAYFQQARWAF